MRECTISRWFELEEKFYEYFGKTNEKMPIIIESSAKSELLVDAQKASLAIEKHEKRQKPARLDFSGAKGVVYLSSDYYIIDGDQAPTDKKEGLLACSKSAKPIS